MAKYSWSLLLCCSFCMTVLVGAVEESRREADRVRNLPGQPPVGFRHYAGYIHLRTKDPKALFYWFFEAQQNVSTSPLVLWLNGGPGCSSIAYGAAQELGPFLVQKNGTHLSLNKHSWNKVANMLFVEAPVGVGFSYTNETKDLHNLGDKVTAEDSYAFLLNWFKRFPKFKSHPFYLAGESYAGHYVPQLADLIYERNKAASEDSYINLKGFLIGNAVINDETDMEGIVDYAWSHAIISDKLYHNVKQCASSESDHKNNMQVVDGTNCSIHFQGFLQAYSAIDIYSIYTPVCLDSSSSKKRIINFKSPLLSIKELWQRLPSAAGYDPCTDDYAEKYFNREDVQRALHANLTKLSYPYTSCSHVIEGWMDSAETVLPIIRKLMDGGLRIWVYSGDTDGRVPVTATRYSIKKMKMKVKEEWRAWFDKSTSQVGGWVETYEEGGLVFATVRGAGHQVPIFAPSQSLSLFSHFLSSTPLSPS